MARVSWGVAVVVLILWTGLPVFSAPASLQEYPVLRGGPPHDVQAVYVGVLAAVSCAPTRPDALGPFYKPNAPVRTRVGTGHALTGTVRSAANCGAIAGARVEIWMVGPRGDYADEFRATVFSDTQGRFRFDSHLPPPYAGRPPHIHVRASAAGHQTLVTQYYPAPGQTEGTFDLVLMVGR